MKLIHEIEETMARCRYSYEEMVLVINPKFCEKLKKECEEYFYKNTRYPQMWFKTDGVKMKTILGMHVYETNDLPKFRIFVHERPRTFPLPNVKI